MIYFSLEDDELENQYAEFMPPLFIEIPFI